VRIGKFIIYTSIWTEYILLSSEIINKTFH